MNWIYSVLTDNFIIAVLHFLQKQPPDFIFSKSTKIHEMPGADFWPEIFKQNAQLILDDFLSVLNKDGTSNLRYIIDQYEFKLSTIIKRYQLKSEFNSIFNEMLLDLSIFYNDKDQEKLSKPFNATFEKIYQKNQNKKIDDLINFDFQNEFIQEYRSRFEKYLPFEFQDRRWTYKIHHDDVNSVKFQSEKGVEYAVRGFKVPKKLGRLLRT